MMVMSSIEWRIVSCFLLWVIYYGAAFPLGRVTLTKKKWVASSTFLNVAAINKDDDNRNTTVIDGWKIKRQRGNNPMARQIMEYLYHEYHFTSKEEWKKARNYVYKATMTKKDPLTVTYVELVCQYLNTKFSPDLSSTVIQQCPRILRRNVESQLIPTVDFLQNLYGYEMLQEAFTRRPDLLLTTGVGYRVSQPQKQSSTVTENNDNDNTCSVENFFKTELGLSRNDIQILKQNHPTIFAIPVETKIRPLIEYLSTLLSSGKNNANRKNILKKIIKNSPRILSLNVDTNLQPKIEFLTNHCGLTSLSDLLKSCPGVLGLSLEKNLKPTVTYLQQILKRDSKTEDVRTELQMCLSRHPQLLALSISNIQSKISYFDSMDDDQHSSLPLLLSTRILKSAPSTFSLSLSENIQPKVECLANLWGIPTKPMEQLENEQQTNITTWNNENNNAISLSKRISEYPVILTLSLEGNINPTLSFYNRTGYIELSDQAIDKKSGIRNSNLRGRHIASSLYNRLLPRWNYYSQHQQQQQSNDDCIPLHLLSSASDNDFCSQLDLDINHYQMYKAEFGPKLKFSSQFDTWLKTGRPIDSFL